MASQPTQWDLATPGTVLNPQTVFNSPSISIASSTLLPSSNCNFLIAFETGSGVTFTAQVVGRIIGTVNFLALNITNITTKATGNSISSPGIFAVTLDSPPASSFPMGNMEIKPVISALANGNLGITTSYSQR